MVGLVQHDNTKPTTETCFISKLSELEIGDRTSINMIIKTTLSFTLMADEMIFNVQPLVIATYAAFRDTELLDIL